MVTGLKKNKIQRHACRQLAQLCKTVTPSSSGEGAVIQGIMTVKLRSALMDPTARNATEDTVRLFTETERNTVLGCLFNLGVARLKGAVRK